MVPGVQLLKLEPSPKVNFYIIGGDVKLPNAAATLQTLDNQLKICFFATKANRNRFIEIYTVSNCNQTDMMRDFNELYYHLICLS